MGMSTTTNQPTKYVIYTRVSTTEQGKSGLGLDAQLYSCRQYVESCGGLIVRELSEVASGNDDERPVLAEALKLAKQRGAKLLVAKLDRLSRAVAVIATMMRHGGEFVVAECAGASNLELHMRASFAEEEREKIAARTVAALAAAKRRGVKLGSSRPGHWKGREDVRKRAVIKAGKAAAAAKLERSGEARAAAAAVAVMMRQSGEGLRTIAAELERRELVTPTGNTTWAPAQVSRLLVSK